MNTNATKMLNWSIVSYKKAILGSDRKKFKDCIVIFDSNGKWDKIDLYLNENGGFSIVKDYLPVEDYDFKNAFDWTMGRLAGRDLLLGLRVNNTVFVYQFIFASAESAFKCLEKLSEFIDDGGQISELSQTQATLCSQNDVTTCVTSKEKVGIHCSVDNLAKKGLPDWPVVMEPIEALEKYLLEPDFIDFVKNVENAMEVVSTKISKMSSAKKTSI